MVSNKQINKFAVKWFEKYRNSKTTEREVVEGFADECFALGFEMDCGESFQKAFPNTQAFDDYTHFDQIINRIDDISLLGSAIFSKWRYITHWSYCEDLLSPENRAWFIIAFSRLAVLSSEDGYSPFVLDGHAKKIKIISNNICYGPCPMPEDEVEQHLTMTADGRVWFTGYNFGNVNGKYERGRTKQFRLDREKADHIFSAFSRFFGGEFVDVFATDIGSWEMTIVNTEGRKFPFKGSLCADYKIDGVDLSDLIRDSLEVDDLYVFDGNCKPDKINRITVDYHRVTKIKPKQPINEETEYVTWNYTEQLIVDRESECIEHIQNIGTGCIVSRKYKVEGGVEGLLDNLDADYLFDNIVGNPPDVIDTPNETKDYTITVDFKKNPQRVIQGSYDKNGLPDDWAEFADTVFSFMRFYGWGEMLAPSIYGKAKRRKDDYIFCSVTFDDGYKSYYYLADDDSIEVGDSVLVPAGKDNHTAIVEVVNIEYFSEEKAPFPIEKVKHIIRKCNNDDYDSRENEEEDIYILEFEPLKGFTPYDVRQWLQKNTEESALAIALSLVHNKTGLMGHELDETDNACFEKVYEEWWTLEKELYAKIIKILEEENLKKQASHKISDKGLHHVVLPFMERNGYRDETGWWIKLQE